MAGGDIAYNATALELGLPQAAKLTPDRERRIVARLKDYGLEGWHKAIGNLRASKFLTGGTDIGFRADLDFVCQAKSFGKLHDGGYAGGRNATRSTSSHEPVLTVAPKKYAMSEAEFEARKEQIGREVWEADQAFGKANNPGTTVQ